MLCARCTRGDNIVFFSDIQGRPVMDVNGKKAGVLADLIFIDSEKYAEVSHLVFETDRKKRKKISWRCVKEFKDPTDNKKVDIDIHLNLPEENLPLEPEYDRELFMRVLLDKQLIDVDGLRLVRVNDIVLGKVDSKFCIVGVDVGTKGLLRRIGMQKFFSMFFKNVREHIIPWEYVEPFRGEISDLRIKVQRSKVVDLRPEDLADIMEDMNSKERVLIFNALDNQKAAETLVEVEPEVQKSVVENMKSKKLIEIIENMPADDAAELLNMLPLHKKDELFGMMRPEKAEVIMKLSQYSSDVAGGLMGTGFTTIPASFSAEETINKLRVLAPSTQKIYYLYVIDEEGKLVGIISLRDLVISPPDKKVADFMHHDIIKVTVETPKDEVYKAINKYNLLALPVVDLKGKLVGVISAEDIINMMIPRSLKRERVKIKGQFRKRRKRSEKPHSQHSQSTQHHKSQPQLSQHRQHANGDAKSTDENNNSNNSNNKSNSNGSGGNNNSNGAHRSSTNNNHPHHAQEVNKP